MAIKKAKLVEFMNEAHHIDLESIADDAISSKDMLMRGREIYNAYSKLPSMVEDKLKSKDTDLFYVYASEAITSMTKDLRNNNLAGTEIFGTQYGNQDYAGVPHDKLGDTAYRMADLLYRLDTAVKQRKERKMLKEIKGFSKSLKEFKQELDNLAARIL